MRASGVLLAICGNLEIPGGNLINRGLTFKPMTLEEKIENDTPGGVDFPKYLKKLNCRFREGAPPERHFPRV